jgi:tetratricopeptide (TPR) repeat protein
MEECRKKAIELGRPTEPAGKTEMDKYSHWLNAAYPSRILRQEYFRSIIQNSAISHANFRLAHLLLERKLATIVVTPNFDDFLSRALSLFGERPILCDHAHTVGRIDPESEDIKILHVHGTYLLYELCNTDTELSERARDSADEPSSIVLKLTEILSNRSPIVIGYSGWENDVVMSALKRRLKGELRNNLFWFCYRRSEIDSVPAFVRNHDDVRFVTSKVEPEKTTSTATLTAQAVALEFPGPQPKEPERSISTTAPKELVPSKLPEQPLDATVVLNRLVAAFNCETPALFKDPVVFFAQRLEASFPTDGNPEEDIYRLKNVIADVKRVIKLSKEPIRTEEPPKRKAAARKRAKTDQRIERVRDAVRRSQSVEAITVATSIKATELSVAQREDLADLIMSAAMGLSNDSGQELAGYNAVIALMERNRKPGTASREGLVKALHRKGFVLANLKQYEEAIQINDQAINRFGEAEEQVVRERVARCLRNKGVCLALLGRHKEAIQVYDQVVQRFENASELELRELVAKAIYNKGDSLNQLNLRVEAIQAYDQVVKRFSQVNEPAVRELVAGALFNEGSTLNQVGQPENAIQTYDQVVQRFGSASELPLRKWVAVALLNKGITLRGLDRHDEAIQTNDEIIRQFGPVKESKLHIHVAEAFLSKGISLGALKKNAAEIETYDQMLQLFSKATDVTLQDAVARVLIAKGVALGEIERKPDALDLYDEVVRRYGAANNPILQAEVAFALMNKGLTLQQLKDFDNAKSVFEEIIQRFDKIEDASIKAKVSEARSTLRWMALLLQ